MTLTPKQEKFAQLYVELGNASEAYRQAYGSTGKASGYYVYALCDPRDGKVFYIGKGKGRRVSHHAKVANRDPLGNREKNAKILDIQGCGLSVNEVILDWFGTDERASLAREFELIGSLRDAGITNISSGSNRRESVALKEARALLASMPTAEQINMFSHKAQIDALVQCFGSIDSYVKAMNDVLMDVIGRAARG